MKVLAYRVKDNDCKVIPLNPDYSDVAENRFANEPEAFNANIHLQKGVHLHFILPSIMKHGLEKKDTNGNKTIQYPFVPDKYIVTRMYVNSEGKIIHDCNIVESAFYSKLGNGITIPFWEKDISSNKNVRSFRHLGRQYSGIVQNNYTGPSAPSSGEGYKSELSGVGPGDPMFNAYYPSCRSVFGYYDNLENVPNNAVLTYSVIGYYSKAEQNLFYGIDTIEDMKKKLQDLNLSVAEENCKVCNSCLLFGEVCNIDLNMTDSIKKDWSSTSIGLGRTSAEVLSAVIFQDYTSEVKGNEEKSNSDIEKILTSIQYDMAGEISQIDGNFNIDDTIYAHGFTSINPLENKTEITIPKGFALTEITIPKEINLENATDFPSYYSNLCKAQKKLGEKRRLLEYKKNKLYYLWESYIKNDADPDLPKNQKNTQAYTVKFDSLISNINETRNEIVEIKEYIEQHKRNINPILEKLKAKTNDSSKKENIKMEDVSTKPFYFPKDPVLMFFGNEIKNTFIFGDDEDSINSQTLSCITTPLFSDDEEINKLKNQLNEITFINEIQDNNRDDYINFCVMTVMLMQDAQKKENSDKYSPVMLNKNPNEETILFMSWKTKFYKNYNDDISQTSSSFEYGNTAYTYIKDKIQIIATEGRECTGKSVLTPHGVCNLKEKLNNYIENHPNDKEILKDIIPDELHTISQNLGGFTIDLSCLQNSFQMPMNDEIIDEQVTDEAKRITHSVYNCLYNQKNNTFYEPDIERHSIISENLFPLREGFLELQQLLIVSTFGKSVDVINKEGSFVGKNKYYSENLQPIEKNGCFLPLALTTPARITSYFVSATNRSIPSNSLPESTPIIAIITPDMLNQNLDIFDSKGDLIGVLKTKYVIKDVGGKKNKVATCTFMESPNYEKTKINTTIDSFINLLKREESCNNESSYFAELMDVIKQKLDNTIPMDQSDLIFGRTLVLAEMNVELDYFGGTEFSKNAKIIEQLNDKGLSKREFPVMIGDINRVTDGVICGFYGGDDGFANGFTTFGYKKSNQFLSAAHPLVSGETTAKVTLLLDPLLKVTLSTGILPVEQIQINSNHTDFGKMNLQLAEMNTLISDEQKIPLPDFAKNKKYTRIYTQNNKNIHLKIIKDDPKIDTINKTIITDGFIVKETEFQKLK